ncbi:MAG TPA: metal-dependent hydrolase [Candidatus Acidoferrales bacterium]|nr:metal-dependent hydrolase [Candidatus Acidoferrales bacterium]
MLPTRGNKVTYLGHATVKITTPDGKVILIDPWVMTNPQCPDSEKELSRVDVILLTHGHGDHLGDLIEIAKEHEPQVVAIFETGKWLEKKKVKNVSPMGKGGTQRVGNIEVTMVHAVHSNSLEDGKDLLYGGEPAGFIVRLPGGLTLYHAGDTCAFGDMKLIAELYKPDLACLPIGDHFTMGPREAAVAIRLLGAHHVLPIHYATFPQLTGTPEALREATQDIAGLEIHALRPGESLGESHAAKSGG